VIDHMHIFSRQLCYCRPILVGKAVDATLGMGILICIDYKDLEQCDNTFGRRH
jgi:hypothetical protein